MKRTFFALVTACASALYADDVPIGPDGKPQFGHSSHGEAYNEGPRQAAVLIPGVGNAHFEVTTKVPDAQRFFDQGVCQLHGFWYFEAERSFRQVVKLDPGCAMGYGALALCNINNEKRAADFMKDAMKRKDSASPHEQAWLNAWNDFFGDGKSPSNDKRKALVKALEKIVFEFPDDLEAKAFLVFHLWDNAQHGIPLSSHTAVDALAKSVLEKNPQHPGIHHYLIHLWNYEDDRRALKSAGSLGQAAPAIAHMWHMPGHTFTRLHRYADAAWQQEASARTDHAHMLSARILPEQIHNYAHNNDWLVEDLTFIGRVRDAIDLAKNMVELPRLAPGAVLIGKDGYPENRTGYQLGRKRLIDVLVDWGHWDELLALENTEYLDTVDDPIDDARRLRALAIAAFQSGNKPKGEEKLAAIEHAISTARAKRYTDADATEGEQKKSGKTLDQIASALTNIFKSSGDKIATLERYRDEVRVYQALANNLPLSEVKPLLDSAKSIPPLPMSRIYLKLGDTRKALEKATEGAKNKEGQVLPLANLADIQWRAGDQEAAKVSFDSLRPLCAQIDLGEMTFTRLKPIADSKGLPADWRPKLEWPTDSGTRPDLATLGPFRWHPYNAPSWQAVDAFGKTYSSATIKGKPTLLVFYLGSGCSHCIEQLNLLAPISKEFGDAGIQIVAVGTDSPDELQKTFVQAKDAQGFPFPITADPALAAFKAYRAFDDFEGQPLHGTFLIDADGFVRWQDISFKPFGDVKWLLSESKRLLALPVRLPQTTVSSH